MALNPDDIENIAKSLDDQDEFVTKGSYCEHCNELVEEVVPVDPYEPQYSMKVCRPCLEIINQGPQDDRWLRMFESLEDKDEFFTPDKCQRCNSTQYVEPVYFNNTSENLCRWCAKELFIDISYHLGESLDDKDEFGADHYSPLLCDFCQAYVHTGPIRLKQEDGTTRIYFLCKFCKGSPDVISNIVTESIEDSDEFGNIKAVAGYEEAGIDTSKHIFVFEDGARLYQDAKVADTGVMYRVVLKTPDGATHRTSEMSYGEDVPMPFSQYWDGMYDFIREGDILPFPQSLFAEFQQVMAVSESINEAKTRTLAEILNTRGVVPDPAVFAPPVPEAGIEGLDDVDEFESRRGCGFKGEIKLRDPDGNDITDSLDRGYQVNMSV